MSEYSGVELPGIHRIGIHRLFDFSLYFCNHLGVVGVCEYLINEYCNLIDEFLFAAHLQI